MNLPLRRPGRHVRLAAASALLLFSAACVGPVALPGRASDEWVRTYTVAPGGQFQLTNVNGQVDVTGTNDSQIEVRAERIVRSTTDQAAADILSRVQIDEDVQPDSVTVTTRGLEGIHIGVSVQVQYHVRVPDTVKVRVNNTNGGIRLTDVHGGLIVRSTNGGVRGFGLEGGVEVQSTNGGVDLQIASVGRDPIEIHGTNGGITLDLPATAAANLSLSATNGRVAVEALKFEPTGDQTRRRVRGRLNGGGTDIDLSVTNGGVRVRNLANVPPPEMDSGRSRAGRGAPSVR
jgi:Toastrack DUF4097